MSQKDLINLQYPPGTQVDVLHRVSNWKTKAIEEHWIGGYSVFDPAKKPKLELRTRQRPRAGEVLLVTDDSRRPVRSRIENIRPHDPKTAKRFEAIYGSASGAVELSGVSFESEQDELVLGVNLIDQEEADEE